MLLILDKAGENEVLEFGDRIGGDEMVEMCSGFIAVDEDGYLNTTHETIAKFLRTNLVAKGSVAFLQTKALITFFTREKKFDGHVWDVRNKTILFSEQQKSSGRGNACKNTKQSEM